MASPPPLQGFWMPPRTTQGSTGETKHPNVKLPTTFAELTPVQRAVLEMGIPARIMHMARTYQLLQHGTDFEDARQLFEASEDIMNDTGKELMVARTLSEALEFRGDNKSGESSTVRDWRQETGDSTTSVEVGEGQAPTEEKTDDTEDPLKAQRERLASLVRENQRLRHRMLCCVCKTMELTTSAVTLLPCGHFVACEKCADNCTFCPACGHLIFFIVRTFLS